MALSRAKRRASARIGHQSYNERDLDPNAE
jgi:hypothetical protein